MTRVTVSEIGCQNCRDAPARRCQNRYRQPSRLWHVRRRVSFNQPWGRLTSHNCLNLRLPPRGGSLHGWEFEKTGVNSMFASKGSLPSTVRTSSLKGRSRVWPCVLTEGVQPYVSKG